MLDSDIRGPVGEASHDRQGATLALLVRHGPLLAQDEIGPPSEQLRDGHTPLRGELAKTGRLSSGELGLDFAPRRTSWREPRGRLPTPLLGAARPCDSTSTDRL